MHNPSVFGGTATKFCVHRGTHLQKDNSGQIEVGGNASDVIIEHCTLDNPKNRILIHEKATGVLLRENQFLYPKNSNYAGNRLEKAMLIHAKK
jgi:hypothetical protein